MLHYESRPEAFDASSACPKSAATPGRASSLGEITRTTLGSLGFARFGTCMLLVHGERNPSAADWSAWCNAYALGIRDHGVRKLLVVSNGGGPSAAQRAEVILSVLTRIGAEADCLETAVCGDAAPVRLITSSLGWVYALPRIKLFPHAAQHEALTYLDVASVTQPPVCRAVLNIEQELGLR